jgi:polyisoprenoid-binding protein YceI
MSQQTAGITIAPGTWTIDPGASSLRFEVKHMWGLGTVKGQFDRFGGTLTVEDNSVDAQLHVDASSVDTHNKQRDKDLRSAKFFDVDRYREIGFELASVTENQSGLQVGGYLLIRESRLRVDLEVDADENGDRLVLRATTPISREAAGLAWNWMGMIRGDVTVHVEFTLTRNR